MSREEIEARKEQMHPWYWWGCTDIFQVSLERDAGGL